MPPWTWCSWSRFLSGDCRRKLGPPQKPDSNLKTSIWVCILKRWFPQIFESILTVVTAQTKNQQVFDLLSSKILSWRGAQSPLKEIMKSSKIGLISQSGLTQRQLLPWTRRKCESKNCLKWSLHNMRRNISSTLPWRQWGCTVGWGWSSSRVFSFAAWKVGNKLLSFLIHHFLFAWLWKWCQGREQGSIHRRLYFALMELLKWDHSKLCSHF